MHRILADQRRRVVALFVVVVLVSTATFVVTRPDDPDEPWFDCLGPTNAPESSDTTDLPISVSLELVSGLPDLTATTLHPDGSLWSLTKPGVVHADVESGGGVALDLTQRVTDAAYEQGLLDLAFSPDGAVAYLTYTDTRDALTVDEYAVVAGGLAAGSRRELLSIEQPTVNHNGGGLVVDDEGLLWISVGDGGEGPETDGISVEDYAHRRSQDVGGLYGKILRIDPRTTDGDRPYAIPSDNPFVDESGARPEVWAMGLRNPWRFTVDSVTGDVWIGDVGQFCTEEVDVVHATDGGANFGWPSYEGDREFLVDHFGAVEDHVPPVVTLEHHTGACSVAGGVVYRGDAFPDLRGHHAFVDSCDDVLRFVAGDSTAGFSVRSVALPISQVVDLEVDAHGELLLTSLVDGVHRVEPAA